MGIELVLALISNIKTLVGISALVLGAMNMLIFVGYMMSREEHHDADMNACKKIAKVSIPLFIICCLLSCIPDVDELWHVRVAMIKLTLASPENVKLGVDHIDLIAKNLECKYLNECPKKEETK